LADEAFKERKRMLVRMILLALVGLTVASCKTVEYKSDTVAVPISGGETSLAATVLYPSSSKGPFPLAILNHGDPGRKRSKMGYWIKTEPIKTRQLEQMKKLAGSYEALFSRRAQKYRQRGLHEKTLTEKEYKSLILEEYTFLKRPVMIVGNAISIGNAKAEIDKVRSLL